MPKIVGASNVSATSVSAPAKEDCYIRERQKQSLGFKDFRSTPRGSFCGKTSRLKKLHRGGPARSLLCGTNLSRPQFPSLDMHLLAEISESHFYLFVCLCAHTPAREPQPLWRSEDNLLGSFLSIMWILGFQACSTTPLPSELS